MTEQLKPCPFDCGWDDYKHDFSPVFERDPLNTTTVIGWIECPYCGARGPVGGNESESAEGWNHAPRLASDATDDCPGKNKCHGSMDWCEKCGTVRLVCDDIDCHVHRQRFEEAKNENDNG